MRFASGNNEMRKKIEDYSYGLTDLIGKGFSSSVFKGINQKTREQVAIKVIDLKSIRDRPAKQMLEGEIDALKKLSHTNIMKCHDIYSTVNNCYIITEFCNEGDLQNLLKRRQKLPENQAIPIFRDIISGFRVIAESGFLHRDLKPANILMKDKVAKIADFGFAKRVTTNSKETVNVGSPLYMSPQALKHNIYTIKNDIWSIGIILYEILHGRAPWESITEKQLIQKINKQVYSINKNISEDLKDFIRKCLTNDENKRLGVTELFNHPFILRITEDQGLPKLIRKQTSCLEVQNQQKIPSAQLFNNGVAKDQNNITEHYLENLGTNNQPTNLHHRKNPHSKNKSQKQFTSQLNFMRFIFRLLQMFPPVEESGRYTFGLRFLATKQMLSQLDNLNEALNRQNIYNFEGWDEFTANTQKVQYYKQILTDYGLRYEKSRKSLEEWSNFIKKDKKLTSFADCNLVRSESLSIMAISYSIEECKNIWADLNKLQEKVLPEQYQSAFSKAALRLDFTMTFYQLNCLLVDSFHDPDYFARNSKIDAIIDNKPVTLTPICLDQLQHKLHHLEIIK